ncbi:hypothetical protein JW868_02710 [Candidatus Woesearchaeota archaeon]|nr:hypothetical protein [Candidatus Woesearchaeota archaeon]
MNTEILEQIGFTKGEVKVYFALLEMGITTIGPLSKAADITPAKVYPILDKLSKKGLIAEVIQSNTRHFEAAGPQKILEYMDLRKKQIEEEKESIQKLIPEIELKQKLSKYQQKAKVYQNLEGMRTLYNEIINYLKQNNEDYTGFTLQPHEYTEKAIYFFREFDTKRRNLGIKTKLLCQEDSRNRIRSIAGYDKNIIVKYIPYSLPTGLQVWSDKIAILIWKEVPTAFVIQSQHIAQAYKKFFKDLWEQGKD